MHRCVHLHVCACTDTGTLTLCKTYDYVLAIVIQGQPLYILVLCFVSYEGHTLVSVKGWKWVYKYQAQSSDVTFVFHIRDCVFY